MTPAVIFRKLLLPKSTSKEDSQNSIGQFGLGFYTTLAHLVSPDDTVLVRTKAQHHRGYKLEFIIHQGKICVHISPDETMINHGTDISVFSKQIKKADFESALIENVKFHKNTAIYLNQLLINPHDGTKAFLISKTQLILDASSKERGAIVTCGGITLQAFPQLNETNNLLVVFDLPKQLISISESRNQIRIESEEARAEIRKLIDFSTTQSETLRIKYLNTIAPLILNLQEFNSSQRESDNLFVYLQLTVQQYCEGRSQIPDRKLLKPLMNEQIMVLHPLLIDPNWQCKIGYAPKEYSSAQSKVLIVSMSSNDVQFIHDEEHNIVYLDDNYYKYCVEKNELWKLSLIFSFPPGKLVSNWRVVDPSCSPGMSEGQSLFLLSPSTDPHELLCRQHSALRKNREAISALSTESVDVIQNAKTIMRVYPRSIFMDSKYNINWLIPYSFKGDTYYLLNTAFNFNGNYLFLNQAFQMLFYLDFLLLKEKAIQNLELGIVRNELTLTSTDRFLILNTSLKLRELYDGEGNRCLTRTFDKDSELRILNKEFYLIREKSTTFLYNIDNTLVTILEGREQYHWVSASQLMIGRKRKNYENAWINIYVIDSRKYILTDSQNDRIEYEQSNQSFVHYIYNSEVLPSKSGLFSVSKKPKCTAFRILSKQGDVVFSYNGTSSIEFVQQQLVHETLYITILFNQKHKKLLICKLTSAKTYDLISTIDDHEIIGYPARGFFSTENAQIFFIHSQQTIDNVISFIPHQQEYLAKNMDWYEYKDTSNLYLETLFIVNYDERESCIQKILIDGSIIVPLSEQLHQGEILNVQKEGGHYLLNIKNAEMTSTYLIDRVGNIITQANRIKPIVAADAIFFLLDDRVLIDQNNNVLYAYEFICEVAPIGLRNLLKISLDKHFNSDLLDAHWLYDLIDYNGHSQIEGPQEYLNICTEGKYISYKTASNVHNLITSQAHFTNAPLEFNVLPGRNQPTIYRVKKPKTPMVSANGDVIFNGELSSAQYISPDIMLADNYILIPLTQTQVMSDMSRQNLLFLNQMQMTSIQYGLCLRFIDIDSQYFQKLYPYMEQLEHIPRGRQVEHYVRFMQHIGGIGTLAHRVMLVKLLDLVYTIAGHYNSEDMADKIYRLFMRVGIHQIKNLLHELSRNTSLLRCSTHITHQSNAIGEMSQRSGQYVFYIFTDSASLYTPASPLTLAPTLAHTFSITTLMTAYRLDTRIIKKSTNMDEFIEYMHVLTNDVHTEHAHRKLIHAIFHQAHPEKCLYIREFLQNAMDAYVKNFQLSVHPIAISISKNEHSQCILTLQDDGEGMSLEHIFKYLLIPGQSSKRHNTDGSYIGGRGVGLFTALNGAKQLTIKTGIGDNQTYHIILTPIYETLSDGQQQIIDITVALQTTSEMFKGTLIQRISMDEDAELEASKYHRAINSLARYINTQSFWVTLNGKRINHDFSALLEFEIPSLGRVKLYKSSEGSITVGGLYVKPYNKEFLSDLPLFIQQMFENHQLLIELPKHTPLNRERNDFENTEMFSILLKKHLIPCFYAAYIQIFITGHATIDELPYDFFNLFKENLNNMLVRNPQVEQDASIINNGEVLDDYTLYQSPQLLTDLMCFLKLIEYRHDSKAAVEMVSMVDLAARYKANQLNAEQCPEKVQSLIRFDKHSQEMALIFTRATRTIDQFEAYEWEIINFDGLENIELFIRLCQKITSLLTNKAIDFYFSTNHGSALAYTYPGVNIIYWNPISLFETPYVQLLLKSSCSTAPIFKKALEQLIETLSHELVHIEEQTSHSGTHNHTFYIRQRELLIEGLSKLNTQDLYDFYVGFFNEKMKNKQFLSACDFIKTCIPPSSPPQPSSPEDEIEYETRCGCF